MGDHEWGEDFQGLCGRMSSCEMLSTVCCRGILTTTILGVPFYNYGIVYPKIQKRQSRLLALRAGTALASQASALEFRRQTLACAALRREGRPMGVPGSACQTSSISDSAGSALPRLLQTAGAKRGSQTWRTRSPAKFRGWRTCCARPYGRAKGLG